MIRNRCDRSGKFKVQLRSLRMRRLDGIHIFKDAIAEVIDILCRNVIARHYYRTDSHRPDILIRSIRGRWDRVFAVIWRFFNQLIHMLIVQADEIHIPRRCQGGDCGRRRTRYDKCRINLAILQRLCAVPKGLIRRIYVFFDIHYNRRLTPPRRPKHFCLPDRLPTESTDPA